MDAWRNEKVRHTVPVVLAAIVVLSLVSPMQQGCVKYLDNWTNKSVGTVVVASGISSGLSVIEDSEVQVSLLGTGGSLALGDSVRPLNDMVGRVVFVALASTVSLGIQRVLIEIGSSVGFKVLLLLAVACQLVAVWVDWPEMRPFANWLLTVALFGTLAIPSAVLLTGRIGDHFTEGAYTKAQQRLNELNTEVQQLDPTRISQLEDSLKSSATAYSEFAVNYIVVFIVQTMVMPVLILWGLVKLIGYLLMPAPTARMEARLMAAIRGGKGPDDGSVQTPEPVAETRASA